MPARTHPDPRANRTEGSSIAGVMSIGEFMQARFRMANAVKLGIASKRVARDLPAL
jgi:hypothetical protein